MACYQVCWFITSAPEAEDTAPIPSSRLSIAPAGLSARAVAPLKLVASAITIGSGGSAGREGPTALIGAGFGSIYATLGHRKDEERSLLVLMGMAAGLSAIFRSPIGAAFFAVEVLYGNMEFEAWRVAIHDAGCSGRVWCQRLVRGLETAFQLSNWSDPLTVPGYAWFGVLGGAAGLIATLLPAVFYRLRDLFRLLPIPPALNPAIGGLGVGLLALRFPEVLGGGYG